MRVKAAASVMQREDGSRFFADLLARRAPQRDAVRLLRCQIVRQQDTVPCKRQNSPFEGAVSSMHNEKRIGFNPTPLRREYF